MIHTVLADDEVLARQKLRQLLRNEPEIDVVGEGATASETIDLVRATFRLRISSAALTRAAKRAGNAARGVRRTLAFEEARRARRAPRVVH